MAAKSYESGEYDSSSWRSAKVVGGPIEQPEPEPEPAPPSNLTIALRYWTGRWPRAVVYSFLVVEPFLRTLSPDEWVEMLDQRSAILQASGLLIDATPFP